jgi:hypothetical protein
MVFFFGLKYLCLQVMRSYVIESMTYTLSKQWIWSLMTLSTCTACSGIDPTTLGGMRGAMIVDNLDEAELEAPT